MLLLSFLLLPVALAVPEACLKNGRVTSLNSKTIETPRENCDEVIKDKYYVDLKKKDITYIEKGALDTLTHIGVLDLAFNKLTDTRFLNSLPDVNLVDFGSSTIQEISPGNFSMYKKFETLYLTDTSITELKAHTLKNFTSLKTLWLATNELKIEPGFFQDLTNLRYLTLFNCGITSLERGVFTGLGKLQFINLRYNRLTEIGIGLFNELGEMYSKLVIDLSANLIHTISAGAFNNLAISKLDLSDNKLTEITSGIFYGLGFSQPSLTIDLSDNFINTIRTGTFINRAITSLDLSDNNISVIERKSFDLPSLHFISVDNNPMTHVDSDASYYTINAFAEASSNDDLVTSE